MRTLSVLTLLAAAITFTGHDAQAAGWCAYYDAYTRNCGFTSFRQCQATAFGASGQCRRDPYDAGNKARDDREPRARRSRDRNWR